jgi:hypothetical protein
MKHIGSKSMTRNWSPPYCPNPDCLRNSPMTCEGERWWRLRGHYESKAHGRVRRYLCKTCGKSFSERIFHVDYYAKRVDINLRDLLFHYCNGFSQRALAEHFCCTTRTIAHKLQILSRQSMAAIREANVHIQTEEDIAIDGIRISPAASTNRTTIPLPSDNIHIRQHGHPGDFQGEQVDSHIRSGREHTSIP